MSSEVYGHSEGKASGPKVSRIFMLPIISGCGVRGNAVAPSTLKIDRTALGFSMCADCNTAAASWDSTRFLGERAKRLLGLFTRVRT
jgi:hypothetical protein